MIYLRLFPIQVCLRMYADDTKCHKSTVSEYESLQLQDDLNSLSKWSKQWRLSFNVSKCVHLSFGTGKNPKSALTYFIDDTPIPTNYLHRDLGITVASDLNWSSHHAINISRAYKMLGLLCRLFSSINSVHEKRYLYISLVQSQLMHCS